MGPTLLALRARLYHRHGWLPRIFDRSLPYGTLMLTYPLIGNYGVPSLCSDPTTYFESTKIQALHSHTKSLHTPEPLEQTRSLTQWLKEEGIRVCGVDTWAHATSSRLRDHVATIDGDVAWYAPEKHNLVAQSVQYAASILWNGFTVVLIDCGVKHQIIHSLSSNTISPSWLYPRLLP